MNLRIYYQNAGSLSWKNKLIDFCNNLHLHAEEYDAIVITESWSNEGNLDAQLWNVNFNIYRRESGFSKGGGVLIGVSKNCIVMNVRLIDSYKYEQLYVTIIKENVKYIMAGILMIFLSNI